MILDGGFTPEERPAVNRIGVPAVIVCPRCEGQLYDQGSCGLCANAGYLSKRRAERLAFSQRVQMAAVLAQSIGMNLAVPET